MQNLLVNIVPFLFIYENLLSLLEIDLGIALDVISLLFKPMNTRLIQEAAGRFRFILSKELEEKFKKRVETPPG